MVRARIKNLKKADGVVEISIVNSKPFYCFLKLIILNMSSSIADRKAKLVADREAWLAAKKKRAEEEAQELAELEAEEKAEAERKAWEELERKAHEDAERKAAEQREKMAAAKRALEEARKEVAEGWQEHLQGLRAVSELRGGLGLLGEGSSQSGPAACWNCQMRKQACEPGK